MLKQRVITALWGLPIAITAVWFDKPLPWFTILVAVCGLLAAFEFFRLVSASKVTPLTYFGMAWTLLFIIRTAPFLFLTPELFLTLAVMLPLIWLLFQTNREQAFTGWAWTVAGILYIGWLLSYLVALRGLHDGRNWVFFTLFTTFAYDTAAFFTGRTWGKHRLAPRISPSKTWEGVIGGILSAIIISLFFILPTPLSLGLNWQQAILLGIMVSIFSQLGDLVESLFKRNMDVKDSGRLMPGHGGILDRIDSLIFAGVIVYYYAAWLAR